MLLIARAAPMAIMAQPASPARPQVKLSNSPVFECWSRSLCDSIQSGEGGGDRRHWCERPEASLCHRRANSSDRGVPALQLQKQLSLVFYFLLKIVRRDGRT